MNTTFSWRIFGKPTKSKIKRMICKHNERITISFIFFYLVLLQVSFTGLRSLLCTVVLTLLVPHANIPRFFIPILKETDGNYVGCRLFQILTYNFRLTLLFLNSL